MRSETEIFGLILGFARADERIRVVVLNGYRANPDAPCDIFQDYDIVYFVTELQPYVRQDDLPALFGEIMILQRPDDMGPPDLRRQEGYAYLMQFADGVRIDLTFRPVAALEADLADESLSVLLLDKDHLIPSPPQPSSRNYLPQPPTETAFFECCNEFWWLAPYVAKGLWRGELIGPKYHLDTLMRGVLNHMLGWFAGMRTDYRHPLGKHGRLLPAVIGQDLWGMVTETYSGWNKDEIWSSLFGIGSLFRRLAVPVSGHFSYAYPAGEDRKVTEFLRQIYKLPPGASRFPQNRS